MASNHSAISRRADFTLGQFLYARTSRNNFIEMKRLCSILETVLSQTCGLSGSLKRSSCLIMMLHYCDGFVLHLFVHKLMLPSSSPLRDHTGVFEASNDVVRCPAFDAKNGGHFFVWPPLFIGIDESPFASLLMLLLAMSLVSCVLLRLVQLILYCSVSFEICEKCSCRAPPSNN